MLVAVNAGSNTLSLFKIDEQEPTKLMRVGEPVDTMGEFPVSVAASTVLNQGEYINPLFYHFLSKSWLTRMSDFQHA